MLKQLLLGVSVALDTIELMMIMIISYLLYYFTMTMFFPYLYGMYECSLRYSALLKSVNSSV